eukprot:CAMPEP_0119324968 /NCGR_PEP_ID=MMETSP1333-20130426/64627_1 /TAXON_ID=418940 /ORGANISM="Scyphosphaera apsteinii, Strain RCC1455" /LENGTH=34 /DNA_ID= /DNA_START= /DNA_END= /DNA_ORIENTATION=
MVDSAWEGIMVDSEACDKLSYAGGATSSASEDAV